VGEHFTVRAGAWSWSARRWSAAPETSRGLPLVAVHGFTGSGADFAPLAEALGRSVIAPDLPGHGGTEGPPAAVVACADALVMLLAKLELRAFDLLGYSLGGRTALHLAQRHPRVVDRLVLVGATAGIEGEAARAQRRRLDEALAARIEAEGVAAFTAWWSRVPIIATQGRIPEPWRSAMRARRLENRAAGLAGSLRAAGQGSMAPLWEALGSIRSPALLVVGEEDLEYRRLAGRLSARLPDAQIAVIPDAGHCAHLEATPAAAAAIGGFLG